MKKKCIFCSIIEQIKQKKYTQTLIYYNNELIIINSLQPKAKIHWLIISFKHIKNLRENNLIKTKKILHLVTKGIIIAKKKLLIINKEQKNFKIIINNGKKAGQEIFHLHIHFLSF